jgi:hypothetical protein
LYDAAFVILLSTHLENLIAISLFLKDITYKSTLIEHFHRIKYANYWWYY